jgi:inosose dehydratase
MSHGEALEAVRRCGLQGVEVEADVLIGSRMSSEDFERCGLCVTAVNATALEPENDLWLDLLSPVIDSACNASAGIVIASAGDDRGDASLRPQLYDKHRRAADRAAGHGLVLAFDTLPGLCGDARGMLRTIQDLQHPAIRLNFDTGRYLQQNPWSSGEVGLQRVIGHLASLRLTNFTIGVEPQEFPPLGQGGDVDCSRTLQILRGLEFSGPCTIAFQPATRRSPTASDCEAWLEQSVRHLRGCGWFD